MSQSTQQVRSSPPPEATVINAEDVADLPWVPFRGLADVRVKELRRSEHDVAGLLRFEPGSHELPHEHRVGDHHMWLLNGPAEVCGVALRPGSYAHVPAGVVHTVSAPSAHGAVFFFVYHVRD